jgi:glycosyltransferase involved in cell wall biosynthesis
MDNKTIFVQIASYRDPELLNTIKDALDKASNPQRLVFGICHQHSEEDEWDTLELYKDDSRFRIIDVNYKDAKGACWARNQIQQQYQGEDYTLQLDSHHRFIENWDQELIDMLEGLRAKGHQKPLLTSYIPSYEPSNDPEGRVKVPWLMNFDRFTPEGIIFFLPATIPNHENLSEPVPARFYSGHFTFADGIFSVEVQHDPTFYFHGEEITLAVRAYTHGYDLFHPHKIIAWHEYTRKGRTKQWDDDPTWGERNRKTHEKVRKLLGVDGHIITDEDRLSFGKYGIGPVRTIADWERYSGIRFSDRGVQTHTKQNMLAPNPTGEGVDETYYQEFKHFIDVWRPSFKSDDYGFCAIILEDKDGKSVYRKDLQETEFNGMLQNTTDFLNIPVSFQGPKPHKWVVWASSKSKGWAEKIEGVL